MGTKKDPGKFDCYAKLADDEPYFVLRGKDPVAWILVNLWVTYRKLMALPYASKQDAMAHHLKLDEATACAQRMREYATHHPSNAGHRSVERALDAVRTVG
jgi:hypothetical protein